MNLITIKNLTSKVHKGIDWELKKGEFHGIIGPSGQGKSYFLKIVLGILPALEGEILGADGTKWVSNKSNIGVQFQHSGLISSLTIGQNIMMPLRVKKGLSLNYAASIARFCMEEVQLDHKFFDFFPAQCSGGMQKRASLARALSMDPDILFLDEPTAGLDPIVIEGYDALLKKISQKGTTIIMVTHDLARLRNLSNRISIILDGKFHTGSFQSLQNSDNLKVKEFLESYVRTVAGF